MRAIVSVYLRDDIACIQAQALQRINPNISITWLYGGPEPVDNIPYNVEIIELPAGRGHSKGLDFRRAVYGAAYAVGPGTLVLDDDVIPFRQWPTHHWERRVPFKADNYTAYHIAEGDPVGACALRLQTPCSLPSELKDLRPYYTENIRHAEIVASSLYHVDKGSIGRSREQADDQITFLSEWCDLFGFSRPPIWKVRCTRSS